MKNSIQQETKSYFQCEYVPRKYCSKLFKLKKKIQIQNNERISIQEWYICFCAFDRQEHFPRLMMCGHTSCQKCISIIIHKNDQFVCPFCKTNLGKLRLGQTYKNFSLIDVIQLNNLEINLNASKEKKIVQPTFSQIVEELDRTPKNIRSLIIKRTRDDETNPFQFDLIRQNRNSMRFYKLIPIFQRLQHFQLWVKFSAHGFEECLAESLYEVKTLKTVRIVNQYDQYQRIREIIPLTGNQKIKFTVNVMNWSQ